MSNAAKWKIGVLAGMALAACENTPTQPFATSDPSSGPAFAQELAETVDGSWHLLLTEEFLQLEMLDAASSAPESGGGLLPLDDAAELAFEWSEARHAGRAGSTGVLEEWVRDAYLEGAIEVFGPSLVVQLVEGTEDVLARVDAQWAQNPPPPDVRRSIERAREQVRLARSELQRGNRAKALRAGLGAASSLRDGNPERRGTEAVAYAFALLERATALAGPSPRPEIATMLEEAERYCSEARSALAASLWHEAVLYADRCATLARNVIALLSGGLSDDALADRAEAVVSQAEDYFVRAQKAAEGDSTPEVQRALKEARELIEQAHAALEAGRWRDAIGFAQESIRLSRRILSIYAGGGPDGGDDAQALAEQAVQHATGLWHRAVELAGEDPRPEIDEKLARAEVLIGDARAALEAGDWRRAVVLARQASTILRRVIARLS